MILLNRVLNNIKEDLDFLSLDTISSSCKLNFLVGKYLSILLDKRNLNYLGYEFNYDTRLAPVILEFYPDEIMKMSKYIAFDKINTVYDVGANVGQWGFTLKYFYPHLKVYSFEPNRLSFSKLKKNSRHFPDWYLFNFGIGKKSEFKTLYYTEESTVGGSFLKDIATEFDSPEDLIKKRARIVKLSKNALKKYKLPNQIDLLKIDVEGVELDVLESLKDVNFKYLIIEVPLKSKRKASVDKIKKIIKKVFRKNARLLSVEPIGNLGIVANAVFKIT